MTVSPEQHHNYPNQTLSFSVAFSDLFLLRSESDYGLSSTLRCTRYSPSTQTAACLPFSHHSWGSARTAAPSNHCLIDLLEQHWPRCFHLYAWLLPQAELPPDSPPNLPHTQLFPRFSSVFIPSRRPTGSQPLLPKHSSLSARGTVKVHLGTFMSGVLRVNVSWHKVCVRVVCARACAHAYMCVPARQGPSTITASDRYVRLEVGCAAVTRRLPGSRSAVSLSRGRRGHSCTRQALFHHMRRWASDSVTQALRHNRSVSDVDSAALCPQIKSEMYLPEQLHCCNLMFFSFCFLQRDEWLL